jgi:hypothetical protein
MPKRIFYDGETRFTKRIKKGWENRGFNYHEGHIQLLKYSWQTRLYWGARRAEKASEENRRDISLRIF